MIGSGASHSIWIKCCIILSIITISCSCSKKPKSVSELYPDAVFDEKARSKQFAVVAAGTNPMIDDLEDGDLKGLKQEGRNWNWTQFDDATGGTQFLTILQLQDAPGEGNNVLYVRGGNWLKTGAGISAPLTYKTEPRSYGVYNASAYSGIQFWVKATGLDQLNVAIATPETKSVDEGGICLKNCPGNFEISVPVTKNWQLIDVPFESLSLGQGKRSLPLDSAQIKNILFTFKTLGNYEVWLDDFAFSMK
jgi:hypothetical protein